MDNSAHLKKDLEILLGKLSFTIQEESNNIFLKNRRKKKILNGKNYIFNTDDIEDNEEDNNAK